jgi:hypothetical protein
LNRKPNNPALILAMLGVYLGLALAGATPQVLAHAALTRAFDIKDEIGQRDELDKDPNDERSPVAVSLQVYLEDVEHFLQSIRNHRAKGAFDPLKDSFEVAQATMLPCVDGNTVGSYTALAFRNGNKRLESTLEWFSKLLTDGYSLPDCLASSQFNGKEATNSKFVFKFTDKDFEVEVAVKKKSAADASTLAADLASSLRVFAAHQPNVYRKAVVENTTFRSDNDQVFVITRLPRAALDPLLAVEAK